ncbi:hypothetical protein FG386_000916 [Cryptosporidium ryanae]|uniref:uncharacterized protein n=1 Tax=Cryptosporidium ryanae TaxID=515981 RepID=UPI00351A0010|nr:hypothetical protein FG386_000916 [Cryptosporidium ryanae]
MVLLTELIEKSYLSILKNIDAFDHYESGNNLTKQQKTFNNELESLLYDNNYNKDINSKRDEITNELSLLNEMCEKKIQYDKKNKYNKISKIRNMIKVQYFLLLNI